MNNIKIKVESVKGKGRTVRRLRRNALAAHMVTALFAIHVSLFTFFSCTIEPPLHFPDEGADIIMTLPEVNLDLDVLWDYSLVIDEEHNVYYDSTYNWRDEWYYGWDSQDNAIFGTWDIVNPEVFNIRRYYTGADAKGRHRSPNEHQIEGRR